MSLHDFIVYNIHINISWTRTGTICSMAFVCGEYFIVLTIVPNLLVVILYYQQVSMFLQRHHHPLPTHPQKRFVDNECHKTADSNDCFLFSEASVFCSLKSPLPYPIVKVAFPLCSDRLQTAFCHPTTEVISLP